MRKEGLNSDCLKIQFYWIVLSKMLYALSAWGGYISAENESRLNKVLRKAKRYGYTDSVLTFSELLEQSDEQLFWRVICSNHCLFHLLEEDKSQFWLCLSDPEVTLLTYLGIIITLPGNLSSIETYIQISKNQLTVCPASASFPGAGSVVDMCAWWLCTVNYIFVWAFKDSFSNLYFLCSFLKTFCVL